MPIVIQKARTIISQLKCSLILFFLLVEFSGCQNDVSIVKENYSILFPQTNAITVYGSVSLFEASELVYWSSSLDGLLGYGKSISVFLSQGNHTIKILRDDTVFDEITVSIIANINDSLYQLPIQGFDPSVYLPSGKYSSFIISNFDIPTKFNFLNEDKFDLNKKESFTSIQSPRPNGIKINSMQIPLGQKVATKKRGRALSDQRVIDSEHLFNFMDLNGTGVATPLNARLLISSPFLNIWVDNDALLESSALIEFIDSIENQIIPRHTQVWGGWKDIDGDGKLSLLITPRFNQSHIALGFFNPADLYPRNLEEKSVEYNPYSNEMDIVYLGCPDLSGKDPVFSLNSLLATFAHEVFHLKSFSKILDQQERTGLLSPIREQTFLEEGLAHFTESLFGYGISGGNIAFVSRYLESPESTSLGSSVLVSSSDTVEQRGGMSLLIDYLFQESGGVDFTADGSLIDQGGLVFLNRISNSYERGWARIEYAVGSSKADILFRFAQFLERNNSKAILYDPVTSEPVTIDPYYGIVSSLGKDYILQGPSRCNMFDTCSLAPISICFGEPFVFDNGDYLKVLVDENVNELFAYFFKEQ